MMFFWIAAGIDLENFRHVEALDNLGEAGYAGRHLVLGDRAAIQEVASSSKLSRKASAYFRSVSSKFAQLAGLRRSIAKINVSPECYSPCESDGEWTVPLENFRLDQSLERTLMLVEHMYDYQVISALAEVSMREQGIAGVVGLSLSPASGGGGGTALTLAVHQRNSFSLGLCVIDSDRPHIRGKLGSTARGCENVFVERWSWRLHVIGARELENIIPPSVYDVAGVKNSIRVTPLYLESAWALYGYMDIKLGDCVCRFLALSPGDQSYAFTKRAIDSHYSEIASSGQECPCDENGLCDPDDTLLNRLAGKIDHYQMGKLRKIDSSIPALHALLKLVVSRGAAAKWAVM